MWRPPRLSFIDRTPSATWLENRALSARRRQSITVLPVSFVAVALMYLTVFQPGREMRELVHGGCDVSGALPGSILHTSRHLGHHLLANMRTVSEMSCQQLVARRPDHPRPLPQLEKCGWTLRLWNQSL